MLGKEEGVALDQLVDLPVDAVAELLRDEGYTA